MKAKRAPRLAVVCLLAFLPVGVWTLWANAPVDIRTRASNDACLEARVGGILVADDKAGLGFANAGHPMSVVWPDGFSARREWGRIVLLDARGAVVAREGDRILAAGGTAGDGAVGVWCHIQVNPGPDA